ncbi:hypothetical protein RGZ1_282 [Morganella phage vB_MmoM_Rgz1]|nr:hypothetical protein RGZ1_282 [Morganella phage vB_MmoM_Rgz1]
MATNQFIVRLQCILRINMIIKKYIIYGITLDDMAYMRKMMKQGYPHDFAIYWLKCRYEERNSISFLKDIVENG